ncbi:MAG: type I 3-dehydroquinate dehydratase [Verrucomicrobiota bacterium]
MSRLLKINWNKPCLRVGTISTWEGLKLLSKKQSSADIVEVRIDALFANNRSIENVQAEMEKRKNPVLLTLRTKDEGGKYSWKSTERSLVFKELIPLADAIDVELKNAHFHKDILRQARSMNRGLILSAHSLTRKLTMRKAQRWMDEFRKHRANVYKIATLARTREDLNVLTRILLDYKNTTSIMAIGPMAQISRTIFPPLGSKLAYGYMDVPAAKTQPSMEDVSQRLDEVMPLLPKKL